MKLSITLLLLALATISASKIHHLSKATKAPTCVKYVYKSKTECASGIALHDTSVSIIKGGPVDNNGKQKYSYLSFADAPAQHPNSIKCLSSGTSKQINPSVVSTTTVDADNCEYSTAIEAFVYKEHLEEAWIPFGKLQGKFDARIELDTKQSGFIFKSTKVADIGDKDNLNRALLVDVKIYSTGAKNDVKAFEAGFAAAGGFWSNKYKFVTKNQVDGKDLVITPKVSFTSVDSKAEAHFVAEVDPDRGVGVTRGDNPWRAGEYNGEHKYMAGAKDPIWKPAEAGLRSTWMKVFSKTGDFVSKWMLNTFFGGDKALMGSIPENKVDDIVSAIGSTGTKFNKVMADHLVNTQLNYDLSIKAAEMPIQIQYSKSHDDSKVAAEKLETAWKDNNIANPLSLKGVTGSKWYLSMKFTASDAATYLESSDSNNKKTWFNTQYHEFGHMLGNVDEYVLASITDDLFAGEQFRLDRDETLEKTKEGLVVAGKDGTNDEWFHEVANWAEAMGVSVPFQDTTSSIMSAGPALLEAHYSPFFQIICYMYGKSAGWGSSLDEINTSEHRRTCSEIFEIQSNTN